MRVWVSRKRLQLWTVSQRLYEFPSSQETTKTPLKTMNCIGKAKARSLAAALLFRTIANGMKCRIVILLFACGTLYVADAAPPPEEIAREIAKGVGEFKKSTSRGTVGPVFVFEEVHTSARGQVQIAIMLHRLHEKHGLRTIGLEGAIATGKPLDGSRFLSPTAARDRSAREDALLSMMRSGEISSAEFAACAYPDVSVLGIENEAEYNVRLEERSSPETIYLILLAEKKLPEEKLMRFITLFQSKDDNDKKKAVDILKEGDPWLKTQFAKLSEVAISTKGRADQLRGIVAEAEKLGVTVPQQTETDMRKTIEFFDTAVKRSGTMSVAMAKLSGAAKGAPTAMIIGAAHSDEVLDSLSRQNVKAVLLRPNALDVRGDTAAYDGFERKNKGLWVTDDNGTLGHILNGHRKPSPIIERPHRDAYADARYATAIVARAFRNSGTVPESLVKELNGLPGIEVDPKSIEKAGNDVIFHMGVDDSDGNKQWVWVRAGRRPLPLLKNDNKNANLETKMLEIEASFGDGKPPTDPPDNTTVVSPDDPSPKRKRDPKQSGEAEKSGHKKTENGENAAKETVKSGAESLILERLTPTDVAIFTKDREAAQKCEMLTR